MSLARAAGLARGIPPMPRRRDALMRENRSYIFFAENHPARLPQKTALSAEPA